MTRELQRHVRRGMESEGFKFFEIAVKKQGVKFVRGYAAKRDSVVYEHKTKIGLFTILEKCEHFPKGYFDKEG